MGRNRATGDNLRLFAAVNVVNVLSAFNSSFIERDLEKVAKFAQTLATFTLNEWLQE
jgi:hypothetical protein